MKINVSSSASTSQTFVMAGVQVTAGGVLNAVLNLLGTMILARAIGRSGMGQYDLLRQVAVFGVTGFSLGIGNASIFLLNSGRFRREEVATALVRILIFLGLVLGIGTAVAIIVFPGYFGWISPLVAACYGLGSAALLVVATLRAFQIALFAAKKILLADIIAPMLMLLVFAILWGARKLELEPALVTYASGSLAAAIVLLIWTAPYVRFKIPRKPRLMSQLFFLGAQLYATNLMQILGPSLAVLVFRSLTMGEVGFRSLGLFTRANALCALGMLVPTATGPLLYARWSGMDAEDRKRHVELAGRMSAFYGASSAVLLSLFGRIALRLLYGAEFTGAQVAVYALAPAVALFSLSNVYMNLFAAMGRAWLNAVLLACSAGMTVILTVILVPGQGIVGAAIASLAGQLLLLLSTASVAWRLQRINFFNCLLPSWDDARRITQGYLRRQHKAERPL